MSQHPANCQCPACERGKHRPTCMCAACGTQTSYESARKAGLKAAAAVMRGKIVDRAVKAARAATPQTARGGTRTEGARPHRRSR